MSILTNTLNNLIFRISKEGTNFQLSFLWCQIFARRTIRLLLLEPLHIRIEYLCKLNSADMVISCLGNSSYSKEMLASDLPKIWKGFCSCFLKKTWHCNTRIFLCEYYSIYLMRLYFLMCTIITWLQGYPYIHIFYMFHSFSLYLKSNSTLGVLDILVPNTSLIHTSFTYSKLNMDKICGLKSHLLYVHTSHNFLLKFIHAQRRSFSLLNLQLCDKNLLSMK